MGISVAVIMKNEEANIADFMATCAKFADEIIINDTGSTDRSVELADMYQKVKIYETKWEQDFSKARNFALSKCTQDWIIWLDLDDRIDQKNADFIRFISKNATRNDVFSFNVKCTQENTKATVDINQIRMFHRDAGLYFKRALHESLADSINEQGFEIKYASQVDIVHVGYAQRSELIRKAKRNLSILQLEETSFLNYSDIAKCYCVLRKYLLAEIFYNAAYKMAPTDDQRNLIATTMLAFLIEDKNIPKINKWLECLVGDSKIVTYYKAEAAFVKGEYNKARELFIEFLEKEQEVSFLFCTSSTMDERAKFVLNTMTEFELQTA
jgi:glycosyltransferase involved in cell wall biosynthesis